MRLLLCCSSYNTYNRITICTKSWKQRGRVFFGGKGGWFWRKQKKSLENYEISAVGMENAKTFFPREDKTGW